MHVRLGKKFHFYLISKQYQYVRLLLYFHSEQHAKYWPSFGDTQYVTPILHLDSDGLSHEGKLIRTFFHFSIGAKTSKIMHQIPFPTYTGRIDLVFESFPDAGQCRRCPKIPFFQKKRRFQDYN